MHSIELFRLSHFREISNQNINPNPYSLFPNSLIHIPIHDFFPNSSSLSNIVVSDEALEHMNYEKRFKKMILNRVSTRRSRICRKMQIEELQYQVDQLQSTKSQLFEKANQLLECNQEIIQENAKLKEKVSSHQMIVKDVLVPMINIGGNNVTCSSRTRIRAEVFDTISN